MTLSPAMRTFLVVIALASLASAAVQLVDSFRVADDRDELHRKDFIQEYVFARAVVAGENPYRPIPEMVARYFDPAPDGDKIWAHPAPHTPVTAVLSVPFALLSYPAAAFAWLIFELAILAFAWEILLRMGSPDVDWQTRIIAYGLSLSLGPVIQELYFGNLSLVLLACLLLAWIGLRKGHAIVGGGFLGLAIAIKLTGWPIVLWLLISRRLHARSAVVAAGAVVVGLHLIALAVLGWPTILDYYQRVGPEIARQYKQHDGNYSLWSIGPRLFAPFDSVFNNFVSFGPFANETLARIVGIAGPIAGLVVGLVLAVRARSFDVGFGILVCVSLPVNPVAWDHTLLVLAIPIFIVVDRLRPNWPRTETTVAALAFVAVMFPQKAYLSAWAAMFGTANSAGVRVVPFALGLITYLPLIALAAWIWLLTRVDHATPAKGE